MEDIAGMIAHGRHGEVFYERSGPENGPLLVLVHGLSTAHEVWSELLPKFHTAGFQTLIYDLYGRGGSEAGHKRYDLALYREQLDDLLTALDITTPFHLIGYSMGGGIVADFALAHSTQVASLHLVAPIGFGCNLAGLWRFVRLPVVGRFFEGLLAHQLKKTAHADLQTGAVPLAIGEAQAKAVRKKGYMPAIRLSMKHIDFNDLSEVHKRLSSIDLPVQAIWAEDDDVIPLSGLSRMAGLNPKIEMTRIENADHGLVFTHADLLARTVLGFIRSL